MIEPEAECVKTCITCGESKSLDEFYRNKAKRNGRESKCRECTKAKQNARRKCPKLRKAAAEREIIRYRANRERSIKNSRVWRDNNRDKSNLYSREARKRNPGKHKARGAVNAALKSGALIRGACEVCGSTPADGHHSSYEKKDWLNVQWLCRKHHMEWHDRHDVLPDPTT